MALEEYTYFSEKKGEADMERRNIRQWTVAH